MVVVALLPASSFRAEDRGCKCTCPFPLQPPCCAASMLASEPTEGESRSMYALKESELPELSAEGTALSRVSSEAPANATGADATDTTGVS